MRTLHKKKTKTKRIRKSYSEWPREQKDRFHLRNKERGFEKKIKLVEMFGGECEKCDEYWEISYTVEVFAKIILGD